jgi:phage shock protein C
MDEKRLMRSTSERMIAGVCGGLAEYFNMDPTLVRIILVLLALAGGPGLLIYLILWVVMPEDIT